MKKLVRILLAGFVLAGVAQADERIVELVKKIKPAVVLIQTFDANSQPIGSRTNWGQPSKYKIAKNYMKSLLRGE